MTRDTGRLALMTQPGQLTMAEYDVPEPERDAVVLEIIRANVCGSELHIWNGHHPVKKRGGLGHEMIGRVHAIGDTVTRRTAGATRGGVQSIDLRVGESQLAFKACHRRTLLGGKGQLALLGR